MLRFFLLPVILLMLSGVAPVLAAEPVQVEISGVGGDALKNVELALALPYGLVRDGKVDRLWLERFARQSDEKVLLALKPFGYYQAQVSSRVEALGPERYRLIVAVIPGPPVRVAELEVVLRGAGAEERELKARVAAFPLKKGEVLIQPRYEQGKATLKSRAIDLGYLDASFTWHEIRIDHGLSSARIEVTFDTGPRYYFDDVRIQGAPEYPESFVHRYVSFKSGEVFSYAKLGETQLNLTNSERFKEVMVTPEKDQAKNFQVPVVIKLTSVPRRSIRPGIGYGTDTGARFTLHYRDLNVLHKGQEFDVTMYAAQRLQGAAAHYIFPNPRDLKSSTAVQLNLQKEDVSSYVSRLVSLELDRNRSFARGELGTVYLKLLEESFTIGAQNTGSRLVLPGIRFTKDRYDNLIRPSDGYRYSLDLRGAHPLLGSDTGLVQVLGEGSTLLPLPWRLSLHLRGKAGTTFLTSPLGDLPPSIRFFAGGDQSVRGYTYQTLGPRDATGVVVGGRHLLVGSVELERALFQKWGVSVFYDAGNAFNYFAGVHIYQSTGVGLHYYSPVGGINVSLATRVADPKPAYFIHVTVGFQL